MKHEIERTIIRVLSPALLVGACALTTADTATAQPLPQSGASGTEYLRRARAAYRPTTDSAQSQSQAVQVMNGGFVFLPGLGPDRLGHGVHYDPLSNTYTVGQKIADFPLNTVSPIASRSRIYFEEHRANQSSIQTSSMGLQLDAAIGLFQAAASLTTSSSSSEDSSSTGFTLIWEVEHQTEYGDLAPNLVSYTPTAQALLSSSNPAETFTGWVENFGTYVVVGIPRYSRFKLTLSLAEDASYEDSRLFAELEASYAAVSLKGSFARAVSKAMTSAGISYSMEGEGFDPSLIDMATLGELRTPEQQADFLGQIETIMESSTGGPTGVVLAPAMVLPGAPEVSPTGFDPFAVGASVGATKSAIIALTNAGRWQRSARLRSFLSEQEDTESGSDFRSEIRDRADAIALALSELWEAAETHITYPQVTAYALDLSSEASETVAEVTALNDVLARLELHIASLSIPVVAIDNSVYSPNTNASYNQTFVVTLKNLALFDNTDPNDVIPFLLRKTHILSKTSATGTHIDYYPVLNMQLDSAPTRITDGPSAGLYEVSYRFAAKVYLGSDHVEFRLDDDLNRPYWFEHGW